MTQLTKLGLFGAPSEQYVASPKRAPGTITKSIGTSSRDYSTISLWEADLDDATIYVSGDDAVGECYNDSDFNESVIIDGGSTTGLNSIKLTAPVSERHDGTAGTGVKNKWTSSSDGIKISSSVQDITISWLEINGSQNNNSAKYGIRATLAPEIYAYNNIIHNIVFSTSSGADEIHGIQTAKNANIYNNIIYKLLHENDRYNGNAVGITSSGSTFSAKIFNNTIHNILGPENPGFAFPFQPPFSAGIYFDNNLDSDDAAKNNLITDIEMGEGHSGREEAIRHDTNTDDSNLLNNATSLSTIIGSNSLTSINTSNQYVSILDGSEDLHLKSGADAIGAGVDLGSSPAGVQYDIDGQDRDLFSSIVWDIGADQRTTPKTIGTAARDYSTIAAWEADLDNTAVYVAGDDAEGHCYNDSDFDEAVLINGGSTVGLSFIKLTSPAGERHDGTAGTGARILDSSPQTINITSSNLNTEVSYLEKNCNGTDNSYAVESHNLVGSNTKKTLQGMIVHNLVKSGATSVDGAGINIGSRTSNRTSLLMNCVIYNISSSTNALTFMAGVKVSIADTTPTEIYNVTIHDIRRSLTGSCFGLHTLNTGDEIVKNVIATDVIGVGASCFNTNINTTASTNLSSDSSATGTNSLVNENSVDEFVSIVSGSEDLHLKIGAKALNNGTNLGSNPAGVQYDLDGYDRSLSTTWDIGADESQLYDGPPEFNGFGGAGRMMMLGVG